MKYILPGMGADSKMYSGPWRELKECRFIDWPPYNNERTIRELAATIIDKYSINKNDIVIGSSLGGMTGLEIAGILGLKKVYLLGSALSSRELSFLSRNLIPCAKKPVVKASQFIASFSKDIFLRTYSKVDPDFIISMSKAILNWQGFKGDLKIIRRIHGRKDPLIKCPDNSEAEVIENGGHLIAITHARECVNFVKNH